MRVKINGREAVVGQAIGSWVRVRYPETNTEGLVRAADLEAAR